MSTTAGNTAHVAQTRRKQNDTPSPASIADAPVQEIIAAGLPRYLQRKPADGAPQDAGESAAARARVPRYLQAGLEISQPGDVYEQEAERVAHEVLRMPDATAQQPCAACAAGEPCVNCAPKQAGAIQRSANTAAGAPAASATVNLPGQIGPGQPLDHATRAYFEPRFGHDFSAVRVHAEPAAEQSARDLSAHAYTLGQDVVFGEGRFAPSTPSGRQLLAHELAHVVQQSGGGNHRGSSVAPMIAREPTAPPMPGALPPSGSPPPMPQAPAKKQTQAPAPQQPAPAKTLARAGVPPGTSGLFGNSSPTVALRLWNYVVYEDHVRIGNRRVDESGSGTVIGSWPWLTNNPGDLTGDLNPRKQSPNDPKSLYWQNKRIWGEGVLQGTSPDKMQTLASSFAGLSENNTAIAGYVARGDLGIFADRNRGRRALSEWIEKKYGNMTLAASVNEHLGPPSTHVAGVDDPQKYPKLLQQYLSEKGYPLNYVSKTKCNDVQPDAWNDVIDAFGFAEGLYSRRAVAGEQGKFSYVENKGVIYRCSGRDAIDVDPAYSKRSRVTNLPSDTPPEIKALLGCP
jgi:hypothetical protein